MLSIYSEPEFERLRAELERVEKEQNILCVSNYVFSTWVVKKVKPDTHHLATSPRRTRLNVFLFSQVSSRTHEAVIHVYDAAGNVTQNARAQGRFQGGLTITFAEISSEASFRIPTRYLCSRPTVFCTSASKRGSLRSGSSFGSALIMVMVRLS